VKTRVFDGKELKALREEVGWGRPDLAKRVGCTRQQIVNLEEREAEPSFHLAYRIFSAFSRKVVGQGRGRRYRGGRGKPIWALTKEIDWTPKPKKQTPKG